MAPGDAPTGPTITLGGAACFAAPEQSLGTGRPEATGHRELTNIFFFFFFFFPPTVNFFKFELLGVI